MGATYPATRVAPRDHRLLSRMRRAIQRYGLWGWLVRRVRRTLSRFRSVKYRLAQFSRDGITYLAWINEPLGWKLYHMRSYEAADLREAMNLVKPGDVCVDVGANTGVYALNLARAVGDRGRTIAFEPLRRNALALSLAAELNGFCNLSVETTVVSNRTGNEVIAISPIGNSALTWFRERADAEPNEDVYLTVRLDDYCEANGITKVDFIKIDAEGAELEVLQGAEKLLQSPQGPRVILLELHPECLARFDCEALDIVQYLGSLGYAPSVADRKSGFRNWDESTLGNISNVFFVRERSPQMESGEPMLTHFLWKNTVSPRICSNPNGTTR